MEKIKPGKKAYQVNRENLDHSHESIISGYAYEPIFADHEREARKEALKFLSNECGIDQDYLENPLTYITVKVKRIPEHDLFLYNGKLHSKQNIERFKRTIERDAGFRKLLEDNPNGYAMIRKGGYYYRPKSCGYTEFKTEAGVYPILKAVNECLGMSESDYMRPELIDVTEHNKMIKAKIEDLKTRLIPLS